VTILGQPFELTWLVGKRQVRHVPDLFCRRLGGQVLVTDCRAVRREVQAQGRSHSGRLLAGRLGLSPGRLEELLASLFASAQPLSAAQEAGDPIRIRPVLFHLLWRGRLSADLGRPLGETTILTTRADPVEEA
jgi:hypothetical protein